MDQILKCIRPEKHLEQVMEGHHVKQSTDRALDFTFQLNTQLIATELRLSCFCFAEMWQNSLI